MNDYMLQGAGEVTLRTIWWYYVGAILVRLQTPGISNHHELCKLCLKDIDRTMDYAGILVVSVNFRSGKLRLPSDVIIKTFSQSVRQ